MEYQVIGYISFLTTGNECQSNADMEDNSGFRYCIQKQPKLELEKGIDYEEKKGKIDRYKKVSSALFKKDSTRI
ncbi:MAG TPA: hypothetical protein VLE02_03375 [Nitrosarchaeum sp.]|nr:hypothetical protein [Nitrosarchaeum sp.]